MPGPDIDRDKLRAMIDKPGDEYDEFEEYNRKKPPSHSEADRHTG